MNEVRKMTREEALEQLKAANETSLGDPEAGHALADDVLCALLQSLGYGDVVEAWEIVDKWYA